MTTLRHVLLIALTAALFAFAAPVMTAEAARRRPAAGARTPQPRVRRSGKRPQAASDSERLPSPVEVEVSAAVEARAARKTFPEAYSLVAEGLVTAPVRDQDPYGESFGTCWAFSNIAALESLIIKREGRALDLSEDNVVARSGFWTTREQRYYDGGYDFMAIAYFARWAGPLLESTDPYPPRSIYEGHAGRPVKRHVQDVAMIPGRSYGTWTTT